MYVMYNEGGNFASPFASLRFCFFGVVATYGVVQLFFFLSLQTSLSIGSVGEDWKEIVRLKRVVGLYG